MNKEDNLYLGTVHPPIQEVCGDMGDNLSISTNDTPTPTTTTGDTVSLKEQLNKITPRKVASTSPLKMQPISFPPAPPKWMNRAGRASRTELYLCSRCNTTSRFARYQDVTKVLETRRGRCGEYSVLMMQLLQGLGYTARWIVDREDHVS